MKQLSYYIRFLCLAAMLPMVVACSTTPPKPPRVLSGFKVIYLHGFGGKREDPYFLRAMRDFQERSDLEFELVNRNWDSVKVDFTNIKNIGIQWHKAVENAKKEAPLFEQEIAAMEANGTPYYLTAYSLGSRVVLDAIKSYPKRLTQCRGIYFMGSAVPKDYDTSGILLPDGMKIINYHSPKHDTVLDISFRTGEGKVAGGQVGFDDQSLFENYRTSCTHVYKGVGVHTDWSQLADPIGYLILQNEGVELPGETEPNLYFRVSTGGSAWHDIILFRNVQVGSAQQQLLIQQHKVDKHYRAVAMMSPTAKRYRVAWGNNLHAILKELSLFSK